MYSGDPFQNEVPPQKKPSDTAKDLESCLSSRTSALPRQGLLVCRGRRDMGCPDAWRQCGKESWYDTSEDHQPSGCESIAEVVSELPIQPTDRAGIAVPDLRRMCVAGQHSYSRSQALLDSDRRTLSSCRPNWGLTGDANARFVSHRLAAEKLHYSFGWGKREFFGSCRRSGKQPSSGGGIRTPDTRIMIPLL